MIFITFVRTKLCIFTVLSAAEFLLDTKNKNSFFLIDRMKRVSAELMAFVN